MTRVAILISGSGSNMLALARSMTGDHPGRPVLVIANEPGAAGLDKAAALGIERASVPHRDYPNDRNAFEAALQVKLEEAQAEVICLAGFMRILTPGFAARWQGRLLNIHPSLLPKYPGLHTHARALQAGDAEHGCTVHEVTGDLDAGPILGQALLQVRPDDSPESLAARLSPLEHRLYPAVLRRFLAGNRAPLML